MEQERVAEQKELDAALVRLTRFHEEISRAATGPTQPVATPVQPDPTLTELHQLRVRVAEMEAVPSPDLIGASEQSVALLQPRQETSQV